MEVTLLLFYLLVSYVVVFSLGLRFALDALRTSSVESLYFETNEALLSFRQERLAIQYYLQPCPSNPAFEFIPQYDFFC